MSGGRDATIADRFHWGYFLDEGKDRTSTRQVTSSSRSSFTRSSNSRVECPIVRMRFIALQPGQRPSLVHRQVIGPVALDLVLGIFRRAVAGTAPEFDAV